MAREKRIRISQYRINKQLITPFERSGTMIAITGNDVLNCVTYADVVEAIEESFLRYEKKDFNMPPRMHIDYGKNAF